MLIRRRFLQAGLLGGMGAVILPPSLRASAQANERTQGFCVTLCNHWSYTGIGWQLGIESSVLSVTDAMEMADRAPHVKTCINLDAHAYEVMAEKFPEVAQKLARYLAAGKVELIGGTYGQPMGTMYGGESNIRQLVYGREAIRRVLGYELATFLEEEEFTHPQIPQIAAGAGFRYASLAQVDTWGSAGIPRLELNAFHWQGKDGTTIPSTPKNSLFGFSPDLKQLVKSEGFQKLRELGKPLVFTWEEFGWEPPEQPAYLKTPEKYRQFAQDSPIEFVTLREYMDKYGAHPKETIYLNMDAWNKLLTWGLGGDQLRILDRKVEALLLAAERFDALAAALGARPRTRDLDEAWKDLLTSQSHDVSLCEYSRWQGDRMAPLERVEDYHNFTWGAIGYNHLDAAQKRGQEVLDASLGHLAGQIRVGAGPPPHWTASVFNPFEWERDDIALSGRLFPIPAKTQAIIVKDRAGRLLPSQVVARDRDAAGNLTMAEVAFPVEKVPGVGYDTYYLEPSPELVAPPATDLRLDEAQWTLENKFLKVRLGPAHGAIVSLIDKQTGREMLDARQSPFPVFRGTPNHDYLLRSFFIRSKYSRPELAAPAVFDSSESVAAVAAGEPPPSDQTDFHVFAQSAVRWTETGPLRATVRATHNWPLLKFETDVSLCAGSPRVEVVSRVLAEIPPALDARDAQGRFPVEIKQGYWLAFAPGFPPSAVIRDFPLAVEPTARQAFHARTFVDLVGEDAGLLVLHAGTQYFRRESGGILQNLLMREWESFWTGEYGWPRYAEYRHALLPHRGEFTNAERLRAAAEFSQGVLTVVGHPRRPAGNLPPRKGFVTLRPENAQLSALRKKAGQGLELRLVEVEGRQSDASVELAFPATTVSETNLLGQKMAALARQGNRWKFEIQPWKIRTFEIV